LVAYAEQIVDLGDLPLGDAVLFGVVDLGASDQPMSPPIGSGIGERANSA
jgi:hypothetical protein